MTTLYYYHDDFLRHDTGVAHPECAARLSSIDAALSRPEFKALHKITPQLNDRAQQYITLIHSQHHLDHILNTAPTQGHAYLDADTVMSPGSVNAALLAVSSVCDAVDRLLTQQANNAFCALRPPGHHAEADRAMGFCLFNNIAIAAAYASRQHGTKRIAIVDFDVHHGNGTQQAFYQEPNVLYASSHEMPHYPGTGYPSETGVGNIVNVPLSAGDGGAEFRHKYRNIILPAIKKFQPDLILISAGFDAHKDDPLASIRLEEDDFAWVTQQLVDIAEQCCAGRILSLLEGGYNLNALAQSVAAHVHTLMKHE